MNSASPQKIYRSSRHKSIGGVCAGIALNKGWSVSATRTVALLIMSLAGVGVFLYLALWIALPSASSAGVTESGDLPHDPFQRSLADRRVAGVCGGLAEFLKIDSAWIRFIYLLSLLCGGLGLGSYFYAWMIVPARK